MASAFPAEPPRTLRTLTPAICLTAAALLLAACERTPEPEPAPEPAPETSEAPPLPAVTLERVGFEALPGWDQDSQGEALPALARSCAGLAKAPDDRPVGPDGLAGSVADWRGPCGEMAAFATGDTAGLRVFLETGFTPFAVLGADGPEGTITGYYEPELSGALQPDATHKWPLYRRPDDIVTVDLGQFRADLEGQQILGRLGADNKLVPYFTRADIDNGKLEGRGLELLWLDDSVEAFFLHIQGSGRIRLTDGRVQRVGFAGSNGLSYTSIGRRMLDQGLIGPDQASAQGIAAWLKAEPEKAREVMQANARFIFFRPVEGEGPIGAQGVVLTPGRSLAVDSAKLPLGAPIWLETTWPGSDEPLRRLVVAQDKGAAIKGAVRGDLFWGTGAAALEQAGRMKQRGRFYLLLPNAVAARLQAGS